MTLFSRLFRRLRYFLRRSELDTELDEEIRFHIEKETEKNVRSGMSPREARRAAIVAFGGVDRHTEGTRQARGTMFVENTLRDVELALRGFRRSPGFSLMVVLTLALGMGAVTAVFGMANQLVFRPLPGVANTSDAVFLRFGHPDDPECCPYSGLALPDMEELKRAATLLDGIASWGNLSPTLHRDGERPVFVDARTVYGDFFEVLGVQPVRGRLLRADETGVDADPFVAVISERLWTSHFGREVDPVGRTLILDDQAFTVVGVAGGGFTGVARREATDVWLPHAALTALFPRTRSRELLASVERTDHRQLVGLPVRGASSEAVRAQLAEILSRLSEGPSDHHAYLAELQPVVFAGLHTDVGMREMTRDSLAIFAGIAAIALLISCANVAGLLLVRNTASRALVAIRRAIGASNGRIARQHLTQSLTFGFYGTAAGIGVAWLTLSAFQGLSVSNVELETFSLDWRVLAFTGILAIGTAAVFGTIPALLAGRFDLDAALRGGGGRSTRRDSMLGIGLSAAQMALTLALIVGAALLTQTLRNLYAADLGLSLEGVSEMYVRTPPDLGSGAAFGALGNDIARSVATVPGVESVAVSTQAPHGGRAQIGAGIRPAETPWPESRSPFGPDSHLAFSVGPGWFEFFGVDVVRGRTLEPTDRLLGDTPPIVLTAALSRAMYGGVDVIGRRVNVGGSEPEEFVVVGIVSDIFSAEAPTEPRQAFFVTLEGMGTGGFIVYVRTSELEAELGEEIQTAVGAVVPDLPLDELVPVSDYIDSIRHEQIALGRLLTVLSLLTVLLSAVGLYGVVSYDVTSRRRELTIRSAVGARGGHIAGIVGRYAGTVVLIGGTLGLLGAYALSQALESRLFEVAAVDPLSYLGGLAVLVLASGLACVAPTVVAWRADPATVLRHD